MGDYQTSYTTGLIIMTEEATRMRRRRANLMRRLQSMKPQFLRGSLIERYKKCGKAGCKCANGPGHGPKYYLSISIAGSRPEMIYVPQDYVQQVRAYLDNLTEARKLLEEICEINFELLKNREDF
jgi:hypothetical protein